MYLEVLVIAEHLDNILFAISQKDSKIVFENENLAIFAGNSQKTSVRPDRNFRPNRNRTALGSF